jgi:hypothetical protein
MTAARCEPPPELRGVDGWHWLTYPDAPDEPAHWQASNQSWLLSGHDDYVTPDFMRLDEGSTRYLSPVAPPAVVRGLVEALEGLLVGCEYRPGGYSFAFGDDVPAGWGTKTIPTDAALDAARSALAAAKEAGL